MERSEVPMVHYWLGRNVDELTRGEAIEALKQCGAMLQTERKMAISTNAVWREMLAYSRRGGSQKPQEGL